MSAPSVVRSMLGFVMAPFELTEWMVRTTDLVWLGGGGCGCAGFDGDEGVEWDAVLCSMLLAVFMTMVMCCWRRSCVVIEGVYLM